MHNTQRMLKSGMCRIHVYMLHSTKLFQPSQALQVWCTKKGLCNWIKRNALVNIIVGSYQSIILQRSRVWQWKWKSIYDEDSNIISVIGNRIFSSNGTDMIWFKWTRNEFYARISCNFAYRKVNAAFFRSITPLVLWIWLSSSLSDNDDDSVDVDADTAG